MGAGSQPAVGPATAIAVGGGPAEATAWYNAGTGGWVGGGQHSLLVQVGGGGHIASWYMLVEGGGA